MGELVSIIMPTYNRASVIGSAVKSVLEQSYKDVELIVVDDNSLDGTAELIGSIDDSRVQYIKREVNGGAAAARNTGIKKAKGEYIAFLDSDDMFSRNKISRQIEMFSKLQLNPGLIFTNYVEVGDKQRIRIPGNVPSSYVKTGKVFPASIFCNPPSSWMILKKVLDVGMFDENLWTMEDLDYFARIVRKYPVYFMNEVLMTKNVNVNKTGSVPIEYAEKTGEIILNKWGSEMQKDRRFLGKFYGMMGKDLTRSGKRQKARSYLLKAFSLNPFKVNMLWRAVKTYFK